MSSTTRHSERQPLMSVSSLPSKHLLTGFYGKGRDFDFFGKTANIADVMEEEQMTYARSHGTHQPPPTQAARQAEIQHQQQRTNFMRQQIQSQKPSSRVIPQKPLAP